MKVKTIITINEMLIMISPLIISFFILLLFSAVSSKLLNVEINNIIPPMMKMAGAKME